MKAKEQAQELRAQVIPLREEIQKLKLQRACLEERLKLIQIQRREDVEQYKVNKMTEMFKMGKTIVRPLLPFRRQCTVWRRAADP